MNGDATWTGGVTFWKGNRDFPADRHVCMPELPFAAVVDGDFDDGRASGIVERLIHEAVSSVSAASAQGPEQVESLLRDLLERANTVLFAERRGGASVLIAAASKGRLVVAHVGDCRLYTRTAGDWRRVTRDHSLREDVEHPAYGDDVLDELRGVVTRQLGGSERVSVDTYREPLANVEACLLCTNGAWEPFDLPSAGSSGTPLAGGVCDVIAMFRDAFIVAGEPDNATIIAMEQHAH